MDKIELDKEKAAAKDFRKQFQDTEFKQAMATSYPPVPTADDFAVLLQRIAEASKH